MALSRGKPTAILGTADAHYGLLQTKPCRSLPAPNRAYFPTTGAPRTMTERETGEGRKPVTAAHSQHIQ